MRCTRTFKKLVGKLCEVVSSGSRFPKYPPPSSSLNREGEGTHTRGTLLLRTTPLLERKGEGERDETEE